MIEAEMKFICDHKKIKVQLKSKNAEYLGLETNNDIYFNHPSRNFIETDEALRLRETDDICELTYKGPKFNRESKSREELNIELKEISEIRLILERLGFIQSGRVVKVREKWKLNDIIITLDNVENLGEYVEFELLVENNLDMATQKISDLATELGFDVNKQILNSYLSLIEMQ